MKQRRMAQLLTSRPETRKDSLAIAHPPELQTCLVVFCPPPENISWLRSWSRQLTRRVELLNSSISLYLL